MSTATPSRVNVHASSVMNACEAPSSNEISASTRTARGPPMSVKRTSTSLSPAFSTEVTSYGSTRFCPPYGSNAPCVAISCPLIHSVAGPSVPSCNVA